MVNVGENLYRVLRPGDKPAKPTGIYYALVKRGRKQFRRSLKTSDRRLAERRLAEPPPIAEVVGGAATTTGQTDLKAVLGLLKVGADASNEGIYVGPSGRRLSGGCGQMDS